MATVSDHIRRDAEHAARCEIAIEISKYIRRLQDEAKASISKAIADSNGGTIDGTSIGREAARSAISGYLSIDGPHEAIEAGGNPAELQG